MSAQTVSPWPRVRAAVRANLPAAVLLWAGLALFLLGYWRWPAVGEMLQAWAQLNQRWGLLASFVAYAFFAVIVPELLVRLLQRGAQAPLRWGALAWSLAVWGSMGVVTRLFYQVQTGLFGEDNDALTLVLKMLVDQFAFSPVVNLLLLGLLGWRDAGFGRSAWTRLFDAAYLRDPYLPIVVAGWCVWIPAVMVVYFMPTALQFPVVSMVLSYWILVFRFLRER